MTYLVSDAFRRDMALHQVEKLEALLHQAVSAKLGADWMLEELAGRCRSVRRIGDTFETYMLDGVPILEVHDPRFETVQEGESWIMKMNIDYRQLVPAPADAYQAKKQGGKG